MTAGTYQKEHYFRSRKKLRFLHELLLETIALYEWKLEAWAVFSNHYHFIAKSPEDASTLRSLIKRVHGVSARWLNQQDGVTGRKVWHNFWETRLTFEKSYLARLSYVHRNAVHHGLVAVPNAYPWCSARWFEHYATSAQLKTVYGMKSDRIEIDDDFEPYSGKN